MSHKGLTPRSQNFSDWYQDVIKAADLAEHSVVRGCMIIKPWGYALWERLQKILDGMIKDTGHQNVYFPLLIPLRFLEKEAEHIEGFAKECAIVTHYRLETGPDGKLIPSPDAKLQEPLIIRPTSEAIIGDAFSNWVQSYKDLPILINQWCNVMRWEMRTRLFLRTSEILWQEGHTVHASQEEAMAETLQMLNVYEQFAFNDLAIPVIKGEKTSGERFPGAVHTFTIESMTQDGKALQAGTSHFLGQNFSKAYNIIFTDKNQQLCHAWTTSWGVTTRLIGALVMTHADDEGLVLPPRVAPDQISILPIIKSDQDKEAIMVYCHFLKKELQQLSYAQEPVRVSIDITHKSTSDKFWNAVKKGVPLRLEIGMKEVEMKSVTLSQRNKPSKERRTLTHQEFLSSVPDLLTAIQSSLLEKAISFRESHTYSVNSLQEIKDLFSKGEEDSIGFASGYCDFDFEKDPLISESLKESKITPRCIPLDPSDKEGKCIFSGKLTTKRIIFAKAY